MIGVITRNQAQTNERKKSIRHRQAKLYRMRPLNEIVHALKQFSTFITIYNEKQSASKLQPANATKKKHDNNKNDFEHTQNQNF